MNVNAPMASITVIS